MFGSVARKVEDLYEWLDQYSDPRTKDFPLVSDPYLVIFIVLMYFIGIWGLSKFIFHKMAFEPKIV